MVDITAFPVRSVAGAFNFLRRKKTDRQYSRHACCIPGSISIAERGYEIEGLVVEISRGGMLFRPATRYILDRTGTEIIVTFATYKHAGRIIHTRQFGYGIRLNTALEQEDIDMIIDEFGISEQSV
jgi:hypothetical protein